MIRSPTRCRCSHCTQALENRHDLSPTMKCVYPSRCPSRSICRMLLVSLLLIVPARTFVISKRNPRVVSNHFSTCTIAERQRCLSTDENCVRSTKLMMAQVSENEAKAGIDKVVNALRKDKTAKDELGNLVKVNNVLGFGSPTPGTLAVRFNASFKKGGMGRSSVPMPFGLGQTNESEGRGTMVGQVKASVDTKTGKVTSCSVFRDLGYGRSFELKV